MLSIEQRQDVLDLLRADHADGSPFSIDEALAIASSPPVQSEESAPGGPSEEEICLLLKSWEWRTIVAPATGRVYRFREPLH